MERRGVSVLPIVTILVMIASILVILSFRKLAAGTETGAEADPAADGRKAHNNIGEKRCKSGKRACLRRASPIE